MVVNCSFSLFTFPSLASPSHCSFSVQGSKTLQNKSLVNSYYSGIHTCTNTQTSEGSLGTWSWHGLSTSVFFCNVAMTFTGCFCLPLRCAVSKEPVPATTSLGRYQLYSDSSVLFSLFLKLGTGWSSSLLRRFLFHLVLTHTLQTG